MLLYWARNKSLQNVISTTQAGPGRLVLLQQEQTSPNHVQAIFSGSVKVLAKRWSPGCVNAAGTLGQK